MIRSWPGTPSRQVVKVGSTRRAPLVPLPSGFVGGVGRVTDYSSVFFLGSASRDSRCGVVTLVRASWRCSSAIVVQDCSSALKAVPIGSVYYRWDGRASLEFIQAPGQAVLFGDDFIIEDFINVGLGS